MGTIRITYSVESELSKIDQRADALLLEQAVELPRIALKDAWVLDHILGEVTDISEVGQGQYRVILQQPWITTAANPAQFINVLFGNSSLQPDVILEDIELPQEAWNLFQGPRFGIAGLRHLAGVENQPLACTALKPMGLSPEKMALLAQTFAEGGIHFIKDDHGIADHPFCPFRQRVRACAQAVAKANNRTGNNSVYVPNLSGRPEEIMDQATYCHQLGIRAVMIAPMLVGMPVMASLVDLNLDLAIFCHPSLAGVLRMSQKAQLGKLFRWFGADAVIYPHFGGRFAYSEAVCHGLAHELRRPYADLRPAFPVPAGGIQLNRLGELLNFYGSDTIFLIGGSLLEAGNQLLARTKDFVHRLEMARQNAP
ncbi:5-methylthioribulose-1-phosphate isomerase [Candidatus Entotheonellaceae bacterium PAL068K]